MGKHIIIEAADATVVAFRMQLENAGDDAATLRRELSQLRGVVVNWEIAHPTAR